MTLAKESKNAHQDYLIFKANHHLCASISNLIEILGLYEQTI